MSRQGRHKTLYRTRWCSFCASATSLHCTVCEALQQCLPVASVSSLGAAGGLTSGVEQHAPIQQYPLQYLPAACVAAAAAAGQLQHSRCRRASLTPAQNNTCAAAKHLNRLAAPCSVALPARPDQKLSYSKSTQALHHAYTPQRTCSTARSLTTAVLPTQAGP